MGTIKKITIIWFKLNSFVDEVQIIHVGGKELSFCVRLKAPFANSNASEEEKVLGKAP